MKHIVTLVVALSMMTMAVPAIAGESVEDRNREWFLDQMDVDFDPSAEAQVHIGEEVVTMTAGEALDLAVDRAGTVDLTDLSAAATHGGFPLVGDIWVIESGFGACPTPDVITESPVPFTAVDAQLFIYEGDIGTASSDIATTGFGTAIGWTTKDAVSYNSAIEYGGISDFFCFSFFGIALNFPFIDGYTVA